VLSWTGGPTSENLRWRLRPEIVKPSVRNNIFEKFQRLYLVPTFSRAHDLKDVYPTQIDNDATHLRCGGEISSDNVIYKFSHDSDSEGILKIG